jgi:hypothetical protein
VPLALGLAFGNFGEGVSRPFRKRYQYLLSDVTLPRVRQQAQIQPSVPGTNRPSGVRRGANITRTAMLVAMPVSFSQRQQVICSF